MFRNKRFLLLLVVFIIASIFRLYNFTSLQYWSGDEEIAAAVVRRVIVERKIALVSPNATTAASLGSFFHLLSVPLYIISSFNPVLVLLLTSLLGIGAALLLFYLGTTVKNTRLGFIISFLYASSFLASLFDRRWWPLSLNTFLTSLAVVSLYQIMINKRSIFIIFLMITIGFAGHADPSLGVIFIASLFSYIVFRPKFKLKQYIPGFLILLLFILPLLLFEIRHPGVIFTPFVKAVARGTEIKKEFKTNLLYSDIAIATGTRLLFPRWSLQAESHFCYCGDEYDPPLGGTVAELITLLLLLLPFYYFKKLKDSKEKKFILLLYIFTFSFLGGSLLFTITYGSSLHQHYFTVIFPLIFILAGYSIYRLTRKNTKLLMILLGIYILINANALYNSRFRDPLSIKQQLVSKLSSNLENQDFSFFIVGDAYFHGGGFTELFILNNKHPKKSYIYPFYDWMYRSHSLYTVMPQDSNQNRVVIIGPRIVIHTPEIEKHVIFTSRIGNMEGYILDNSQGWFSENLINTDITSKIE